MQRSSAREWVAVGVAFIICRFITHVITFGDFPWFWYEKKKNKGFEFINRLALWHFGLCAWPSLWPEYAEFAWIWPTILGDFCLHTRDKTRHDTTRHVRTMPGLYDAAERGDLEKVKRLIRNGANVEERGGGLGKLFVCVWRWSDSPLRISAYRLSWFGVCRLHSFDRSFVDGPFVYSGASGWAQGQHRGEE